MKEDQDVAKMIILNWILKKQDGMVWTGFICIRIASNGGFL
jgi:hypothetical protein